jgi:thiol-disulfide isomerase/thioredoxin
MQTMKDSIGRVLRPAPMALRRLCGAALLAGLVAGQAVQATAATPTSERSGTAASSRTDARTDSRTDARTNTRTDPRPSQAAPSAAPAVASVAWRASTPDATLDLAFAEARSRGVPMLLFWGAAWCPPCNRLKATLFRQADFVALTGQLVPIGIDGDAPGAQQLGTRFGVRAYPTLVLLAPDGREITRLPGEVDTPQVLAAVQRALSGGRPVSALWADARAGRALSRNEWRMLAWYPWEVAPPADLPEAQRPALMADLAAAAARPGAAEAEALRRLQWKALVLSNAQQGLAPDRALEQMLAAWLADPAAVRRHADLVLFSGDDLVRRLVGEAAGAQDPKRLRWQGLMDAALRRLQADNSLSRGDRLAALGTRVELARLDERRALQPQRVGAELASEVRRVVAQLDREMQDPHERQAVLPTAAHTLARVGAWSDAEALLQGNLGRVAEPYALMSQLASQARNQNRTDDALRWSAAAFERSRGPATRLQWGAAHLAMRVELAPQDTAGIEQTALRMLDDAARDTGAFHERSERSLQARLQAARDRLCAAQAAGSAERGRCERWWPSTGLAANAALAPAASPEVAPTARPSPAPVAPTAQIPAG